MTAVAVRLPRTRVRRRRRRGPRPDEWMALVLCVLALLAECQWVYLSVVFPPFGVGLIFFSILSGRVLRIFGPTAVRFLREWWRGG